MTQRKRGIPLEANHKKILRAVTLEIRHILEGRYDETGKWHPGDLERRLNELGVRRDREAKPLDELPHLSEVDKTARKAVDAYLKLRDDAGVPRSDAVGEFVRESAYTWANRLICLRCMEARELIDEVVLQKDAYAERSLVHNRFVRKNAEACTGPDEGLFAVLFEEFTERAKDLPILFDPKSPAVTLRPSVAALRSCLALLSGREKARSQDPATDEVFTAPDALGWAYQYWNTEEKDRVFEMVGERNGAKIEGAGIVASTQLYTESYMVKFLVQNSLGAIWMGMHPSSRLWEQWEYYVKGADRAPVEKRPVKEVTFLDPACGSGHFLLEAFDLYYDMYGEEGEITDPVEVCRAILTNNLHGIDIDHRAIQLAAASLWMRVAEKAPGFSCAPTNLVATNIRLPLSKDHLNEFLQKHPEDLPLRPALELVFTGLQHVDEVGSLLQIEEPVERALKSIQESEAIQSREQIQEDFLHPAPIQDALPLGTADYPTWKQGILQRLMTHFETEAESVDLIQAFWSQCATKALALVEVLTGSYDVVATNPPYMGKQNLGGSVKSYVRSYYREEMIDLYACFVRRSLTLAKETGYISMVLQRSFLYLQSYESLRAEYLNKTSLGLLCDIGPHGFDEIQGEKVNTILMCVQHTSAARQNRTVVLRISGGSSAAEKRELLGVAAKREPDNATVFVVENEEFRKIPSFPFAYRVPGDVRQLFEALSPLSEFLDFRNGMFTGDNDRFVRFWWETPHNSRSWHLYTKGAHYSKWSTSQPTVIRWDEKGERVYAFSADHYKSTSYNIYNERFFFRKGLTLNLNTSKGVSVRELEDWGVLDVSAVCAFPSEALVAWMSFLNSSMIRYFLQAINPTMSILVQDLGMIPVPAGALDLEGLDRLGLMAIELKRSLRKTDLTDTMFDPIEAVKLASLREGLNSWMLSQLGSASQLAMLEGEIDVSVFGSYNLTSSCLNELLRETGLPSSWLPEVPGHSHTPEATSRWDWVQSVIGSGVTKAIELSENDLLSLRARLRSALDPRRSFTEATVCGENEKTQPCEHPTHVADYINEGPTESLCEALAMKEGISPATIYCLIREGIDKAGWRWPSEERRMTADRTTVIVLRLLGHRWPTQARSKEILPDWVDKDGIIPLTDDLQTTKLLEGVRRSIASEFECRDAASIEHEFEEIMERPLDEWLERELFSSHVKQFRKRPIAWHVQSGRYTARTKPAFACLVYYHKTDVDALPKIRTQYVGNLLARYQTEVRTLGGIPNPTGDQAARKVQLDNWIDELQAFDAKLEAVTMSGFGPEKLHSHLRQSAIDDAILQLKSAWLAKLGETIQKGPLATWVKAAADAGLDCPLGEWIKEAFDHLNYHCFAVGVKPPKESTLKDDPGSSVLAALICPEAKKMVKGAIQLANEEWWKKFDDALLSPIKAKLKEARAEQKELKEELKALGKKPGQRAFEITQRLDILKGEIKALNNEKKDLEGRADKVRKPIEKWTCPEAETWETWLAQQPMYDAISSLDEKRKPPVTVEDFIRQESMYAPDINDGVRVNIAPLQKAGILAADVLAKKDVDKAIADRSEWRRDERRWVREGKLPQLGWWAVLEVVAPAFALPQAARQAFGTPAEYALQAVMALSAVGQEPLPLYHLAGAFALLTLPDALVRNVPEPFSATASQWRETVCDQPTPGLLRPALMELAERGAVTLQPFDGESAARLSDMNLASDLDAWVRADAFLALKALKTMDRQAIDELLGQFAPGELDTVLQLTG